MPTCASLLALVPPPRRLSLAGANSSAQPPGLQHIGRHLSAVTVDRVACFVHAISTAAVGRQTACQDDVRTKVVRTAFVAPGLSLKVFKLMKSCCTCTLVCSKVRALPLIVAASAERLCSDAGQAPAVPGSPAA
jgi:hypothetical protein